MTKFVYSACKIDSLILFCTFLFFFFSIFQSDFSFQICLHVPTLPILISLLFFYLSILIDSILLTFAIILLIRCYIHSEIPYEDQTKAFQPAPPGKIKIIIANNTAVSSITFPDVDTVVCFGTHKSLKYSQDSHETYLANTWISKMTAIQRAGRTGRVRPGTVYRLYTEDLSKRFDDEDVSEIFRYDKMCLKII